MCAQQQSVAQPQVKLPCGPRERIQAASNVAKNFSDLGLHNHVNFKESDQPLLIAGIAGSVALYTQKNGQWVQDTSSKVTNRLPLLRGALLGANIEGFNPEAAMSFSLPEALRGTPLIRALKDPSSPKTPYPKPGIEKGRCLDFVVALEKGSEKSFTAVRIDNGFFIFDTAKVMNQIGGKIEQLGVTETTVLSENKLGDSAKTWKLFLNPGEPRDIPVDDSTYRVTRQKEDPSKYEILQLKSAAR